MNWAIRAFALVADGKSDLILVAKDYVIYFALLGLRTFISWYLINTPIRWGGLW